MNDPIDTSDFFDLSLDPMLVSGFDGYVQRANSACCSLLGVSEEELRKHNFGEFIHPDDLEPSREQAARMFTGDTDTVEYENRILTREGTYRWLRWSVQVVMDRQLIYAVAIDVDDRRRAEEALAAERDRYETLLQAVSDFGEGFLITDGKRYLYANDAYCRLSGYSREEVLGFESVWVPTPPEDREVLSERVRERLSGGQVQDQYEARLIHKDGHYVDVEVAVKMSMTPEGPRLISLVRDVSESKRMREFHEKFIADAAHELRNPIATLTGMIEVLESSWRDMSATELETSMGLIGRQGVRLGGLVTNMLDLTRLQQGRLDIGLGPIELADVAAKAVESNPAPEGVAVANGVPEGLTARGDEGRLDQVVTNLLVNAFRYGGPNVTLSGRSSNGWVELVVSDDGAGVPADVADRLFVPFTRGGNASGTGGAGLGLAIVHELVAAQDGEIEYASSQNGGACFVVRLRPA